MNSCATLSLESVKGEQSPATPYLAIVFTRLGFEPSYNPKSGPFTASGHLDILDHHRLTHYHTAPGSSWPDDCVCGVYFADGARYTGDYSVCISGCVQCNVPWINTFLPLRVW